MESSNPIFIIGSPRSGTTLLRLILTCHSEVIVPPECGFIIWLRVKYQSWSIDNCFDDVMIESFVNDLLASKKFDTWGLNEALISSLITKLRPRTYAQLCMCIYKAYAESKGGVFKYWGDKNNYYVKHLYELSSLYSGAKFIHIVRDGRDVACSYREVMRRGSTSRYAPELPVDVEGIANKWRSDVRTVSDFFAEQSVENNFVVRYEDIVISPESTVNKLCEFLGIGFERKMLSFHSENKKHMLEPELTSDWKAKTFKPIDCSSVGRYKQDFTVHETEFFQLLASDELSLYGYC